VRDEMVKEKMRIFPEPPRLFERPRDSFSNAPQSSIPAARILRNSCIITPCRFHPNCWQNRTEADAVHVNQKAGVARQ
jgi:hypothetical protein